MPIVHSMRRRTRHAALATAATLALLAAACSPDIGTPTEPPTAIDQARALPAADRETAAQRWFALTRVITGRREVGGPLGTVRAFALVSVAQYDAVIAAGDAKSGATHPSQAGAAAAAGAAVLGALYPVERAVIDSQFAADAPYFANQPAERDADYDAGVAIGRQVAAAVLARAATDGSNAVWTGTVPTGPGFWRNAPAPARPVSPLWGQVRPWNLDSGDQFRPAAPPAFGSPEFLAALAEVRRYTDERTPAQLVIAQFWQFGSGPAGPMGYFGAMASELASGRNMDERAATRMYATLYMAMFDASIGCWDAKYAYWYIRPFQADPLITTPVGRPNFPAYPSAHSCLSAAAAGVLADIFPSAAGRLQADVEEAGVARLYAGLHFRFDVDAGRELGYAVARQTLARAPRAQQPIPLD